MGAFRFFILIFVTWFGCGAAFADKRVALVIGNSAYKNVARLTNPVNDAAAVVGMFKNAGFKEEKLVALTPSADKSDQPAAVDLPRSLQAELRRVGCNTGAIDANWSAAAQKALDLFNKHTG